MSKIWKRKDRDCWIVDFRDSWGKRVRMRASSRQEAEELLSEKVKESRRGCNTLVELRDVKFGVYAQEWMEKMTHELESATCRSYAYLLNNHVLPELGHMEVRKICRRDVKALLSKKRRENLGKNSLRLIRSAISTILSDCVDDEIVESNVALLVSNRKKNRRDAPTLAEKIQNIRPMNPEQLQIFGNESEIAEPKYSAFFETLAKAGLRPGEGRALKIGDLDIRERRLNISKALSGTRLKSTKTGETREVDVRPDLLRQLQRQILRMKEEALKRGRNEIEWLFADGAGQPLEDRAINLAFKRILRKSKLPEFRVYDLRHTYASTLLANGAPITYVSKQMGHKKPTTTLQYYAHWIEGDNRRYVDQLDRSLKNLAPELAPKREIEGGTAASC